MLRVRTRSPGWRRSLPDKGDKKYRFHAVLKHEMLPTAAIPPTQRPQQALVDNHKVLDQGQSSGCTGFGTAPMVAVERKVTTRSATFIYAEARFLRGELASDNGAYGRDAVAVAATLGVPSSLSWSHRLDPVTNLPKHLFEDPPERTDALALKQKAATYHPLASRQEFRSCLQAHTFCLGITCYSNLFDDPMVEKFGIVPMPAGSEEGGHWLWFIGSDFSFKNSQWAQEARNAGYPESLIPNEVYEFQNSWGPKWGRRGRGVIQASYIEDPNLADDGQTLRGFPESS